MYNYGDSGNYWGILIGILVGTVIVFLVLREVWCWYWKLNKIVSLLEGQNQLLALLTKADKIDSPAAIEKSAAIEELNLEGNESFLIEKEMKLYNDEYNYDKAIQQLNTGDIVVFIKKGGKVSIGKDIAPMFFVKTKEGNSGWCFSAYLKLLKN
jgi:hypothetical protein